METEKGPQPPKTVEHAAPLPAQRIEAVPPQEPFPRDQAGFAPSQEERLAQVREDLATEIQSAAPEASLFKNSTRKERGSKETGLRTVEQAYDFGRGSVTVIHVMPEAATSQQEKPLPPVVFAHGYGQEKALQHNLALFAQEGGRETIGVAYTGRRKIKLRSEPMRLGETEVALPAYQVEKARDIVAALEALQKDAVAIVGTSEGAFRAAIAAALDPARLQHVILVHPAGMGEHRLPITLGLRMGYQFAKSLLTGVGKQEEAKQDARLLQTALEHPGQLFAEGMSVGFGRISTLVPILNKRLAIAAGEGDVIYPAQRLRKQIPVADLFTFFVTKGGGHGIGQRRETVREIVAVLEAMEQSQAQTKHTTGNGDV